MHKVMEYCPIIKYMLRTLRYAPQRFAMLRTAHPQRQPSRGRLLQVSNTPTAQLRQRGRLLPQHRGGGGQGQQSWRRTAGYARLFCARAALGFARPVAAHPPPPVCSACASQTKKEVRACSAAPGAVCPRLCGAAFCASRVLPRRCASLAALARSGAARPQPLRGRSPAYPPKLRPPPAPAPRLLSAARVRAYALRGRRSLRSASPRPPAVCGLPTVALAAFRACAVRITQHAGSPPALPLRGFGGGFAPSPGRKAGVARLFLRCAPAFCCGACIRAPLVRIKACASS